MYLIQLWKGNIINRLKIVSWNVNGLRAIYKKNFLEWFESSGTDILCLQETKASEDQLPDELRDIKDYKSYFSSAERKGYSGVGLYSNIKPNNIIRGFEVPEFDNEGRIIIAEYDAFSVFNIYYPNGGAGNRRVPYKLEFYEEFLRFTEKYRKKNPNIIICGDLNTAHREIDLARPKQNSKNTGFLPEEREWIDKFLGNGYIDTFRAFNQDPDNYTWWDYKTRARDRNVGWRIDYFFTTEEFQDNIKNSFILPDVMGSDHCPIAIEIEV